VDDPEGGRSAVDHHATLATIVDVLAHHGLGCLQLPPPRFLMLRLLVGRKFRLARMAQQRGISGDEIRREQEASRRRSQLGRRGAAARELEPYMSMIVTWVGIDWLMPLAACAERGFGKVGLALAAVAIALDFFSSRSVTIWRDDVGVRAAVRHLWQRAARARSIAVDDASLRYWNAWFCRGFELVGAKVFIAASARRGSWLRPPLGVPAVSAWPRFRPTARSFALNLPNILLNAGTIAAVWNTGRFSVLISLVALHSMASSFSNCLLGGPELRITTRA
jgi:hypothetical protein